MINGINVADGSGGSVSAAGDVNGDGYDDIIIGANHADPQWQPRQEKCYVIFGSPSLAMVNAPATGGVTELVDLVYTEHDGATIVSPGVIFSDADDFNFESAIVQISAGFDTANDSLIFVGQNGISGSYNAATGTLTLTGTASIADYNTALQSVTYQNAFTTESTAARTIDFSVNDGDDTSAVSSRTITFVIDEVFTGTPGADIINGGFGDDFINGGEGADTIDGGDGFDIVSFAGETSSVGISISSPSVTVGTDTGTDTITNVEGFIGTDYDDFFTTSSTYTDAVFFDGGEGNDFIRGGLGNDTFIGGLGDDLFRRARGADDYDGGAGMDRISTYVMGVNATQAFVADLSLGTISNNGYGETITFTSIEGLSGWHLIR